MALRQSQQDVDALKAQLEDDEYAQRLETEGVSLWAKQQQMKGVCVGVRDSKAI